MDYKKLSIALGFVVAFLVGCVVHDVVRVAPPARAGATPQRWEYHCNAYQSMEWVNQIEPDADAAGAQGWEMVTIAGGMVCFKRPLP